MTDIVSKNICWEGGEGCVLGKENEHVGVSSYEYGVKYGKRGKEREIEGG